jgi:hypothetical protein
MLNYNMFIKKNIHFIKKIINNNFLILLFVISSLVNNLINGMNNNNVIYNNFPFQQQQNQQQINKNNNFITQQQVQQKQKQLTEYEEQQARLRSDNYKNKLLSQNTLQYQQYQYQFQNNNNNNNNNNIIINESSSQEKQPALQSFQDNNDFDNLNKGFQLQLQDQGQDQGKEIQPDLPIFPNADKININIIEKKFKGPNCNNNAANEKNEDLEKTTTVNLQKHSIDQYKNTFVNAVSHELSHFFTLSRLNQSIIGLYINIRDMIHYGGCYQCSSVSIRNSKFINTYFFDHQRRFNFQDITNDPIINDKIKNDLKETYIAYLSGIVNDLFFKNKENIEQKNINYHIKKEILKFDALFNKIIKIDKDNFQKFFDKAKKSNQMFTNNYNINISQPLNQSSYNFLSMDSINFDDLIQIQKNFKDLNALYQSDLFNVWWMQKYFNEDQIKKFNEEAFDMFQQIIKSDKYNLLLSQLVNQEQKYNFARIGFFTLSAINKYLSGTQELIKTSAEEETENDISNFLKLNTEAAMYDITKKTAEGGFLQTASKVFRFQNKRNNYKEELSKKNFLDLSLDYYENLINEYKNKALPYISLYEGFVSPASAMVVNFPINDPIDVASADLNSYLANNFKKKCFIPILEIFKGATLIKGDKNIDFFNNLTKISIFLNDAKFQQNKNNTEENDQVDSITIDKKKNSFNILKTLKPQAPIQNNTFTCTHADYPDRRGFILLKQNKDI